MFSTDKQMGYQCFVSFFDLRDPSQIGKGQARVGVEVKDAAVELGA
jgi:translation initiation factor 3 subunit I